MTWIPTPREYKYRIIQQSQGVFRMERGHKRSDYRNETWWEYEPWGTNRSTKEECLDAIAKAKLAGQYPKIVYEE